MFLGIVREKKENPKVKASENLHLLVVNMMTYLRDQMLLLDVGEDDCT